MTSDDRTDFDLDETDRLLTTTKQVRKRLDLDRPVPRALILECIDIAQHAPMGGNLERNRWLVVDDPDLKSAIAGYYEQFGRPYLAANADMAGFHGSIAPGVWSFQLAARAGGSVRRGPPSTSSTNRPWPSCSGSRSR